MRPMSFRITDKADLLGEQRYVFAILAIWFMLEPILPICPSSRANSASPGRGRCTERGPGYPTAKARR